MPKIRVHNEHFDTVSLGGRKSCPSCHNKLEGRPIIGWYEYVAVERRLVQHFCQQCWPDVKARLLEHSAPCGCIFELVWHGFGYKPDWLTMDNEVVL